MRMRNGKVVWCKAALWNLRLDCVVGSKNKRDYGNWFGVTVELAMLFFMGYQQRLVDSSLIDCPDNLWVYFGKYKINPLEVQYEH